MENKMVKRYSILGLMLIMLLALSSSLIAATLNVGSGETYSTIAAAIAAAGDGTGDIISIEDATHTEQGITVNKSLTIQGYGVSNTIVQAHATQGSATDRVFLISSGKTVTIKNMTIRNGNTTSNGGGIYNDDGTLTLMNCTVSDNIVDHPSEPRDGGGIYNEGTLALTNCTLSGNTSRNSGGGIYNHYGTLTLTNSTVSENSGTSGGGISVYNSGTFTMTDCTVSENSTTSVGGGIQVSGSTLTMTNCTVSGNSTDGYDGGDGGGIYYYESTLTMTNCTVSGNTSDNSGGGIYTQKDNDTGTLTMTNCTVSGNTSYNSGGGIYDNGKTLTMTNCTINDNTSSNGNGGGIYNDGTLALTNCTLSGNSTDGYGGGLYTFFSKLHIKNTIIADNTASSDSDDFYDAFFTTVNDSGYNIVGESNYTWSETGDWTDQDGNGTFSKYGTSDTGSLNLSTSLADNNTLNGTQTLKVISGSIAISNGLYDASVPTDQRGANRHNPNPTIGAYEYYDDSGTLPVVLSTFTGEFVNSVPTLFWTTQVETDNLGWNVYRNEMNDFTSAQAVNNELIPGHGTTSQVQEYSYEDTDGIFQPGDDYWYWLESVDYSGTVIHYNRVALVHIPEHHNPDPNVDIPSKYGLQPATPNPFDTNLSFTYMLPQTDLVRVEIYNILGQLIAQSNEGERTADEVYTYEWNSEDLTGRSLSSGVILIKLITPNKTYTQKAILLD